MPKKRSKRHPRISNVVRVTLNLGRDAIKKKRKRRAKKRPQREDKNVSRASLPPRSSVTSLPASFSFGPSIGPSPERVDKLEREVNQSALRLINQEEEVAKRVDKLFNEPVSRFKLLKDFEEPPLKLSSDPKLIESSKVRGLLLDRGTDPIPQYESKGVQPDVSGMVKQRLPGRSTQTDISKLSFPPIKSVALQTNTPSFMTRGTQGPITKIQSVVPMIFEEETKGPRKGKQTLSSLIEDIEEKNDDEVPVEIEDYEDGEADDLPLTEEEKRNKGISVPSSSAPVFVTPDKQGEVSDESVTSTTGEGKIRMKMKGSSLDDKEIVKLLTPYSEFAGWCFSDEVYNTLKNSVREGRRTFGIIINLDSSLSGKGTHWVALFVDHEDECQICYYDSFGDAPPTGIMKQIKNFSQNFCDSMMKFKYNRIKRQHFNSKRCGYYAVVFLRAMFSGLSFKQASGFTEQSMEKYDGLYERFGFI